MQPAHVRSFNGVLSLKQRHRTLKALQKSDSQPSLHGHQIWQSSYLVMDYLTEFPLEAGSHVLEIGCGWGLLGIFCAKHFHSDVLLTDADHSVFPYTLAHISLNDVKANIEHISYERLDRKHLTGQDIILGSDICFWPEMTEQLKDLILRAFANNVQTFILADPGRPSFMKVVEYCRMHFDATLCKRKLSKKTSYVGYILTVKNPGLPFVSHRHCSNELVECA